MNLIEEKEEFINRCQMIKSDIMTDIEYDANTYWDDEIESIDMVPFCFDSPVQLMGLISQYIEQPELTRFIVAYAFKHKYVGSSVHKDENAKQKDEIPEFVYAF